MKKLILAILSVLTVAVFFYSTVTNSTQKLAENGRVKKKEDSSKFVEKNSEGKKITSTIKLFDNQGKQIDLKDILNDSPKLIFRFSQMDCKACIDEEFDRIKRLSKQIGINNVLIITDYENPRNLRLFIKMNLIDVAVYNCEKFDLLIEERGLSPYVFLLSKEGYTQKVHYLDKSSVESTKEFYKDILRFFQSIKN